MSLFSLHFTGGTQNSSIFQQKKAKSQSGKTQFLFFCLSADCL